MGDAKQVQLVLVRHADAISETDVIPDAQRYLTLDGRAAATALGEGLARAGVSCDRLISSPLVRAVQTAERLTAGLGYAGLVEIAGALAALGQAREVLHLVRSGGDHVIVVGHEPHLSALGSLVTGRARFPPLARGQCCLLDGNEPKWTLSGSDSTVRPWRR